MGQGRQPDLDCSASSFLESSKFTLSIHLSSLKPLFIFWLIYIQQYIKQNIVVVKKGEYDHNWISSLWAYHWQTKQWTCRRYKEERNIKYICKAPQSVTLIELVINPHSRWKLMQCLDLLRDIATKESRLSPVRIRLIFSSTPKREMENTSLTIPGWGLGQLAFIISGYYCLFIAWQGVLALGSKSFDTNKTFKRFDTSMFINRQRSTYAT